MNNKENKINQNEESLVSDLKKSLDNTIQEASFILNELIQRKISSRSMRDMEQLQVSRPKTEIGRSSFRHRAAIIWNVLPMSVKTIRSYPGFKFEFSKNFKFLNNLSFGQSSVINNRNNDYIYF